MTTRTPASARRGDALSRRRIVEAAIELLDEEGGAGLTFRSLSTRLSTGPGAIYWHVANKDELLLSAAAAVLAPALIVLDDERPQDAIRQVALGVFDAMEAHPWVGGQLAGPASLQPAMLTIFERLGQQVTRLGVPAGERFAVASALLNYVLGVAMQEAANDRYVGAGADRVELLTAEARAWEGLDPATYPFLHEVARQMRDHDDRAQFLTGVDLILAGIEAGRGTTRS